MALSQTVPELKKMAVPIISSNNPNEVALVVACIRVYKSENRIKPIAETRIKNAPKKKKAVKKKPAAKKKK